MDAAGRVKGAAAARAGADNKAWGLLRLVESPCSFRAAGSNLLAPVPQLLQDFDFLGEAEGSQLLPPVLFVSAATVTH